MQNFYSGNAQFSYITVLHGKSLTCVRKIYWTHAEVLNDTEMARFMCKTESVQWTSCTNRLYLGIGAVVVVTGVIRFDNRNEC